MTVKGNSLMNRMLYGYMRKSAEFVLASHILFIFVIVIFVIVVVVFLIMLVPTSAGPLSTIA